MNSLKLVAHIIIGLVAYILSLAVYWAIPVLVIVLVYKFILQG